LKNVKKIIFFLKLHFISFVNFIKIERLLNLGSTPNAVAHRCVFGKDI